MDELGGLYDGKLMREYPNSLRGTRIVIVGTYTIATFIEKEPNQPHLVINKKGEGVLSNSKAQKFKITYKKHKQNEFGSSMLLYTIQTADGKYLALSGVPTNGNRLITQKKAYLWCIGVPNVSRSGAVGIYSPENAYQSLNAVASKTVNGTPHRHLVLGLRKKSHPRQLSVLL